MGSSAGSTLERGERVVRCVEMLALKNKAAVKIALTVSSL